MTSCGNALFIPTQLLICQLYAREDILAMAPSLEKSYIRVPKIGTGADAEEGAGAIKASLRLTRFSLLGHHGERSLLAQFHSLSYVNFYQLMPFSLKQSRQKMHPNQLLLQR